jgi:hypothetical protein
LAGDFDTDGLGGGDIGDAWSNMDGLDNEDWRAGVGAGREEVGDGLDKDEWEEEAGSEREDRLAGIGGGG